MATLTRFCWFGFTFWFAIMGLAPMTMGQAETATISGIITDEGGGTVPNCEVQLQSVERGGVTTVRTNDAGLYVFPSAQPGLYNLTVRRNGFKQVDLLNVIVNVQDHIEQNFRLQVGSVSESVTVTDNGLNVNTTDAAVSTVIDRSFVSQLPLNGRSFNTLLQLTPGVVIAPANNLSTPGQFSIAGQRTDANIFTVDGVSANFGVSAGTGLSQAGTGSAQAFSALGGTSSLVSVDALQEFRVETSSFAPEFGRFPGGQVILSTRSGTNAFHGGVFDYFRNTVMDANDWFANQAGNARAAEHHNDFGGFLGGPIWKDKIFFFVSYEGARLDLPQTQVIQVPSEYSRSIAPTAVAPFLGAYPKPDDSTVISGVFTSPFTGTYSDRATLDAGSVRIDYTINERFSIFGRYNNAPSETVQRSDSLSEIATTPGNTQTATAGLNMALGSRISNTIRANYSTQTAGLTYSMDSFAGATPFDPSLLLGNLPATRNEAAFISFDLPSYAVGAGAKNRTKQANVVDGLSVTAGRHQLKFGGDYLAIFLDEAPAQYGVDALVSSTQTFVSPGTAGQLLFLVTGLQNRAHILTQAFSLYGQDSWKVTRRLILTYGLRWELAPAPSALGSTTLASWINTSDPAKIMLAPSGTPLWRTTYGNFAPRLGLAYSLTDSGDLVLRAGGGVFYDLGVGQSAILGSQFPNTSVGFTPGLTVPIGDPTPYLPGPASLKPPYPSGVFAFANGLILPRSYQWSVAVEKSLGNRHAVSLTYMGQAGRDLLRQTALYQPNPNFLGELLFTQNDAWSNYNALQLQYRRPMSTRLQALLGYTWSHSLDNSSNDVVVGLSNAVISGKNDYASSDFDVRQSFSGALTFSMPAAARTGIFAVLTKDWSLDAVIVARTGFPFNAVITSASPDPGGYATSRPDLVPGQPLWIPNSQAGGGKSLNPAAFAIPSSTRQGTEGRNDIPGFGLTQLDLSLGRRIPVTERVAVQFRADAFNLLNHPNFTNPSAQIEFGPAYLKSQQMLNQGLGGLNPLFQEGGPRSLQVSLKVLF